MATERTADDGTGKARRRAARRAPAPHERQRDPERTKARLIEAAIDELSEKGFAGARVSSIAARAGVNQQLIAYYFDGKEGLFREIGRQWRAYEEQAFPEDLDFPETIKRYTMTTVDPRGPRLMAWQGLAGSVEDAEETREREARLRDEVETLRARQRSGELDDRLDPAALLLIGMSAGSALAVYPQLARSLLGADPTSPEVVEHYADQLAAVFTHLANPTPPETQQDV